MENKIYIVNESSSASEYGIGTYLNEYIYCLKQLKFQVNVISLFSDADCFNIYVDDDGVRYFIIPHVRSENITLEKYYYTVFTFLKQYSGDENDRSVFHFNYHESGILIDFIRSYFKHAKIIYTIHYCSWDFQTDMEAALDVADNSGENISLMPDESDRKEKELYDKVDSIVSLSDDTSDFISKKYGIARSKINLIPNGLRDNFLDLSESQRREMRNKYYIDDHEKIILFVGRLIAPKGINDLLACFKKVLECEPDCRLVLVGDGDFVNLMRRNENIWTKVTFTGKLDKNTLANWYRIADIGIFPSYHEQCSYVCIEMMMHGLPCIVSAGNGIRTMFQNNGSAVIVDNRKANSEQEYIRDWTNAICRLISSDDCMNALSMGARLNYQTKYSIDVMLENYRNFFYRLLG